MPDFSPCPPALDAQDLAAVRLEREAGLPPIRNDYRRHYSRWHDDSDEHFDIMVKIFTRRLAPHIGGLADPAVLEIGCGMGFCLAALQKAGFTKVAGIDADSGQVAAAQARSLPAHHVPVASFPAYAHAHRDSFDLVLLFDVFEHIPVSEQQEFLREILSMLRPGGRLLCQVPNANSIVASRFRYIDATHHASFTETSLDFLLYSAGFEDIVIDEADKIIKPTSWRWRDWSDWAHKRLVRHAIRRAYGVEIGRDAWVMPLSGNLLATASRR